ncbi:hypothetical protein FACS189474_5200 [Bacteroidia bacterium]|nr:hypothetical protein FACS189474_5200 [Bacteroidia bacterium]
MTACSSGNKYEKTIADYIQTDKHGTKFDMNFKVIEIAEIQRITVADSMATITEAFNAERNKKIESLEESVKRQETSLEKEKNSRFSSKTMIVLYTTGIERGKHAIDSLKTIHPTEIEQYENRKPDDLLAVIVRCKYSIVPPMMNTTAEETFDFTLSPDGTKCYGKQRAKN